MRRGLARFLSCFVFPRERRRAFRARFCEKKESDIERLESKVDLLTRMYLLGKVAPNAWNALCPPVSLSEESSQKLITQQWANLGENGRIKCQGLILQAQLLRELFYVLPYESVVTALHRLQDVNQSAEVAELLTDVLSWVYRRAEKYDEAVRVLDTARRAGGVFSPLILRRAILCNFRSGSTADAEALMSAYHRRFGVKDLWKSSELTALSEKQGKIDEEMGKISRLTKDIQRNLERKQLEAMLLGKRVAVVGNAPTELGKGHGVEIDGYDIVIRFNDFPTDPEFVRDYGRKTDVWCCSVWAKTHWRKNIQTVILGDFFYSDEYPNFDFAKNANLSEQRFWAIPLPFYQKTLKESGIKLPTLGCLLLTWLKDVLPTFTIDDVFGFSFKEEQAPSKLEHYYRSEATRTGTIHNLDEERVFLRKLFNLN